MYRFKSAFTLLVKGTWQWGATKILVSQFLEKLFESCFLHLSWFSVSSFQLLITCASQIWADFAELFASSASSHGIQRNSSVVNNLRWWTEMWLGGTIVTDESVSLTEYYTQSGNGLFMAYIPSWQCCSVHSSWEGRYTPSISSLPLFVLCGFTNPVSIVLVIFFSLPQQSSGFVTASW